MPVFAFFAAGVTVGGYDGFGDSADATRSRWASSSVWWSARRSASSATTWLLAAFTRASLDAALRWIDVLGVAMLAGIGFTVSLLIGELAFGSGSARDDVVKVAVLTGSVAGGVAGRGRAASAATGTTGRSAQMETVDADHDGVPDVYESGQD